MKHIHTLLLALVLAACAADPAPRGGLPAPAPEAAVARADTGRVDLSAVPDSLRACIPDAYLNAEPYLHLAVRFEVVGAVDRPGGGRRVLLEYFSPEEPRSAVMFDVVVLDVGPDGACAVVGHEGEVRRAARAMLEDPALARRSAELSIEAAGGPEEYVRVFAGPSGDLRPRECGPLEETGCFTPQDAAIYRDLGVTVAPPGAVPSAADLSAVPDSLRSCIPRAFLEENVRFELIGIISPAGSPDQVLLEYFDDDAPTAPTDFHPVVLEVTASGCTSPSRYATDGGIDHAFSLLTDPALARRSAELHVEAAGGPERYARWLRSLDDPAMQACRPGDIPTVNECYPSALVEAYRDLGVPID